MTDPAFRFARPMSSQMASNAVSESIHAVGGRLGSHVRFQGFPVDRVDRLLEQARPRTKGRPNTCVASATEKLPTKCFNPWAVGSVGTLSSDELNGTRHRVRHHHRSRRDLCRRVLDRRLLRAARPQQAGLVEVIRSSLQHILKFCCAVSLLAGHSDHAVQITSHNPVVPVAA
jgi:hypothetical protein